jgi:hypothetical protein
MLIIEIEHASGETLSESVGIMLQGRYHYTVTARGREIAEGDIDSPTKKHWSVLLSRLAQHAKEQEFERVVGEKV